MVKYKVDKLSEREYLSSGVSREGGRAEIAAI
jgi:hypothetical protein